MPLAMTRQILVVLLLGFSTPIQAENAEDNPILILNTGAHTARIRKVLCTPDGKEWISVSNDKTIRTWDVANGEPLRVLRPPIGLGPVGMLYAAALNPEGRTLAVSGFLPSGRLKDRIELISLPDGRPTGRVKSPGARFAVEENSVGDGDGHQGHPGGSGGRRGI